MFPRLGRAVAMATAAVLTAAVLTVSPFVVSSNWEDAAVAAPSPSSFDPGFIISDAVMFDFGALDVAGIQLFLNSKVSACDAGSSMPCLKDYRANTRNVAAVANRCLGNISGAADQTAAQIIYTVAQACAVNPKVLLVTLQKEQGLVTATSTTEGKYRIAMGYGCPDTAPCDSDYFGFFNQVYQAAYAFNKYTKSPEQYPAYQPGTRKINYNPKSSCGTATVSIQNKATTALYTYTPYVPNAAALANIGGVGDNCSSYGNRNFWAYFTSWFGSPVGGSFIVDTAEGQTFVLIEGVKWEVPTARPGLISTLAPLGTVGRVSRAYVDGFPNGNSFFNNLVTNSAGQLYLLDGGNRYTIRDCAQAAEFGYACAAAPVLSDDMLALFGSVGEVNNFVKTAAGISFVLQGGAKRELLDAASAAAEGITLPAAPSALQDDTLLTLTFGRPIVRAGALVATRGTTDRYLVTPAVRYKFSDALMADTGLGARFGGLAGSLQPASVSFLAPVLEFNGLFTEQATGTAFVLTRDGKAIVSDPAEWGTKFPAVDPGLSNQIPVSGTVSAPLFLREQVSGSTVLLKKGKRQPVLKASQMKVLAKGAKAANIAVVLSAETARLIGRPLFTPGTIAKSSKKSKSLWLIDGASKKRPVTARQATELTGSTKAKVTTSATLQGYRTVKGSAKPGLKAVGKFYLADSGILRQVSASDAKRYGSNFGFGMYDATTVGALKKGVAIGRVIKSGSKYYEIKNAKKVRISTAAAKKLAKSTGKKTQPVSKYFASLLTTK